MKLQRNKQRSHDLCWKVHDRAQCFALCSHTLAELRNRQVVSITAIIFFLSNSYFRSSDMSYSYIHSLPFTGLYRTDQMTNSKLAC